MEENIKVALDKTDRKILFELDKNCRISPIKLAKLVNKSRQTVEYRINNLVEKGVILKFQASINPHKFGHKIHKIYFKLKNIPEEKEKLFDYVRKSANVYWMGEFSGKWDLIFGVFAKDDKDFFEFKNKLISKFNKIIIDEEGGILIEVKQYPKKYFTNENATSTTFAGRLINSKLDRLDFDILEILTNNGRASLVEIASKLKATATAVKNRMNKLEKLGVIIQYRIAVDIGKIGKELYKSIIKFDKYSEGDEKKFVDYVSNLSEIQYLINNIWQTELELVVDNYKDYHNIIENLKKEFPDMIRTVDTLLMITDEWTPGFKNLLKN